MKRHVTAVLVKQVAVTARLLFDRDGACMQENGCRRRELGERCRRSLRAGDVA